MVVLYLIRRSAWSGSKPSQWNSTKGTTVTVPSNVPSFGTGRSGTPQFPVVCRIILLYGNTPLPINPTRQRGLFLSSRFSEDEFCSYIGVQNEGMTEPNLFVFCIGFFFNPQSAFRNHQFHWRGTQVVRERSAKPLCAGSSPARASRSSRKD